MRCVAWRDHAALGLDPTCAPCWRRKDPIMARSQRTGRPRLARCGPLCAIKTSASPSQRVCRGAAKRIAIALFLSKVTSRPREITFV